MRRIRTQVESVSILSDQTNWLDELNSNYDFYKEFDQVFNSYHMGQGKRAPELFPRVAALLQARPSDMLFIDDNEGHVGRARSRGLNAVLFLDGGNLAAELQGFGLLV